MIALPDLQLLESAGRREHAFAKRAISPFFAAAENGENLLGQLAGPSLERIAQDASLRRQWAANMTGGHLPSSRKGQPAIKAPIVSLNSTLVKSGPCSQPPHSTLWARLL